MKKTILYLGNKLASKGFTPTGIDTLGPKLEALGFVVFYASSKRSKPVRLLDMVQLILRYRKQTDYVLIDTYSTQNFCFAYAAALVCKRFRLNYIPILHGGNLPERLKRSQKASDFLFKNAYRLVAPSTYLAHHFENTGYTDIEVIPNMLDLTDYRFKFREEFQPKLLWVRSFAAIYNPMLALEVLEKLRDNYPDAQLCMVGPDKDGSLEACKMYALKKGLPVTFTGKQEKTEWLDLAADYAIFINTTHIDNTPVSVLEAMALGLPVVSTRVGGVPYIIKNKETGLLVADGDRDEFVKAIISLVDNKEKAQNIVQNAQEYTKRYDWNTVKEQWSNILT